MQVFFTEQSSNLFPFVTLKSIKDHNSRMISRQLQSFSDSSDIRYHDVVDQSDCCLPMILGPNVEIAGKVYAGWHLSTFPV